MVQCNIFTNTDFDHGSFQQLPISFMNKVYHLGNCSTCQEIFKKTKLNSKNFELQNIKEDKITEAQLEEMKDLAGSFEALFSRRALKYKSLKLKDKELTEKDYRHYILEEYTFLKRPVVIINNAIFIGSEKKNIANLQEAIKNI